MNAFKEGFSRWITPDFSTRGPFPIISISGMDHTDDFLQKLPMLEAVVALMQMKGCSAQLESCVMTMPGYDGQHPSALPFTQWQMRVLPDETQSVAAFHQRLSTAVEYLRSRPYGHKGVEALGHEVAAGIDTAIERGAHGAYPF